jgi:mitogen-activated protein kinase kinase
MSDAFGARTLKRKNVKGLALNKPPPRPAEPAESNQRGPGGNEIDELAGRTQQLEIGIEYKLDLKREDLEVLKELGSGNGGTVSKVRHIATGTIMARKVHTKSISYLNRTKSHGYVHRSSTSKRRRKSDAVS